MNDLNLPERCKEFKSQRYAFADSSPRLSSFVELSFELPEDTILNNRVSVGQIKTQTAFLKDPFADLLSVNFEAVGLQARTNIHVPSVARHTRLDTGGKEVWGVTSMNKYIYILSQDSVLKYDPENPFKPVEDIDIDLLQQKYLTDIAASPNDRCLYVTDKGDSATSTWSCIWKVEIGTDTYRVSKWLEKIYVRLFTLSVSSKGHVTVPLSAKGSNKLRIYNADGKQMKEINLPEVIVFLNHAIELASGNFVVAFGKSGDYQHGVCEINSSGHIVKNITFCDSQVLNHPWHVTVFANDELLIADSKNDRVLWLNSDLTVKKELLTKDKDGIVEPRDRKSVV